MPKITFFNLPEDKKQTLIDEARKEFSRVPLYEASISNIIKGAGIPRGSFYQYFEDKEDIFFFILGEFTKEKRKQFLQLLQENKGNIESAFLHFFEVFIKEKENYNFLRNALLHMTYKTEKTFEKMIHSEEFNERFIEFTSMIDQSSLNVSNDKELFHVLQILMSMTIRNLIHSFALELPYEKAKENYEVEMKLLRKGLFK